LASTQEAQLTPPIPQAVGVWFCVPRQPPELVTQPRQQTPPWQVPPEQGVSSARFCSMPVHSHSPSHPTLE
jgi:hypothetical protein